MKPHQAVTTVCKNNHSKQTLSDNYFALKSKIFTFIYTRNYGGASASAVCVSAFTKSLLFVHKHTRSHDRQGSHHSTWKCDTESTVGFSPGRLSMGSLSLSLTRFFILQEKVFTSCFFDLHSLINPTLDLVADLHWIHSSIRCSHVVDFQHPGGRVHVWAWIKPFTHSASRFLPWAEAGLRTSVPPTLKYERKIWAPEEFSAANSMSTNQHWSDRCIQGLEPLSALLRFPSVTAVRHVTKTGKKSNPQFK